MTLAEKAAARTRHAEPTARDLYESVALSGAELGAQHDAQECPQLLLHYERHHYDIKNNNGLACSWDELCEPLQ